jgi:Sec7-like guanine-nucleotide exchange factor
MEQSPQAVANFFLSQKALKKSSVGNFLGEKYARLQYCCPYKKTSTMSNTTQILNFLLHSDGFCIEVLANYLDTFDFKEMSFDDALRYVGGPHHVTPSSQANQLFW